MGLMSLRNNAVVPTMAKSSWQARINAFRASSALRCESMKSTCTLRPARPPRPLMNFANALTPLTTPWNRPGRTGLSTSAITAMRIVSLLTPTSESCSGWDCRGAATAPDGTSAAVPAASATMSTTQRVRLTGPPVVAPVRLEPFRIVIKLLAAFKGWARARVRSADDGGSRYRAAHRDRMRADGTRRLRRRHLSARARPPRRRTEQRGAPQRGRRGDGADDRARAPDEPLAGDRLAPPASRDRLGRRHAADRHDRHGTHRLDDPARPVRPGSGQSRPAHMGGSSSVPAARV